MKRIHTLEESLYTYYLTIVNMWEVAQDLIDGTVDENGEWSDWAINGFNSEEEYEAHKRREKKQNNAQWSTNFLREKWIEFIVLNQSNWHLRVWDFDFYPTTWLFVNTKTKKKWRWVRNLVNLLS